MLTISPLKLVTINLISSLSISHKNIFTLIENENIFGSQSLLNENNINQDSTINKQSITTIYANDIETKFWIDGTSQITNVPFGSDDGKWFGNVIITPNNLTLGSLQRLTPAYYDTNIQELIMYDDDQTSNRTEIEANINEFYNTY